MLLLAFLTELELGAGIDVLDEVLALLVCIIDHATNSGSRLWKMLIWHFLIGDFLKLKREGAV